MNSDLITRILLRAFTIPLSWVYGLVMALRNIFFEKGWVSSVTPPVPTICVGNLNTGGTGKTPFIEYLVTYLYQQTGLATISRGYRRQTKGYRLATAADTAADIGDEPRQLLKKFPHLIVSVGEKRLPAIHSLLMDRPDTRLVLLDDAFQHRSVRPHLNILLTDYHQPYFSDKVLPAGHLREFTSGASRADVQIVTKCPLSLTQKQAHIFASKLKIKDFNKLYFSYLKYSSLISFETERSFLLSPDTSILLVAGVANPRALIRHLQDMVEHIEMILYPDHHSYTKQDIDQIRFRFQSMVGSKKILVTTEKDAVRFESFREAMYDLPLFIQPVTHDFMFSGKERFDLLIDTFIQHHCKQYPIT